MRIALVVVALVVLASPAAAQTHPCEQPAIATQTIASGAPHRLQWCSPAGNQIEAVIIILDDTPIDLIPVTAKTGASATGLILYESPLVIQVTPGTHILVAATYNRNAITGQLQVGPPSNPFTFAAVDETPRPAAPIVIGVSR